MVRKNNLRPVRRAGMQSYAIGASVLALAAAATVAWLSAACAMTPTPPATATPTPTVAPTPTATNTPEAGRYMRFLLDNPETSEGFTDADYQLAVAELERFGFPEPDFYEAFNAKIKMENKLGLNPLTSPDPEKTWEIVQTNWTDVHGRLYVGSEAQCSIGKAALAERIPGEQDREVIYGQLWYPQGLWRFQPSPDWPTTGRAKYTGIQDGLTQDQGKVAENIRNLPAFSKQVMGSYSDTNSSLNKRARQTPHSIPDKAFPITLREMQNHASLFESSGDGQIDLARYIHGLSIVLYNEDAIGIDEILAKSVGCAVFEQRAPYNHGVPDASGGNFTHGEIAIPVPSSVLSTIRNNPEKYGNPIVLPGQTIGWMANTEVVEGDGIPYIIYVQPDVFLFLQMDGTYDMVEATSGYDPKMVKVKRPDELARQ